MLRHQIPLFRVWSWYRSADCPTCSASGSTKTSGGQSQSPHREMCKWNSWPRATRLRASDLPWSYKRAAYCSHPSRWDQRRRPKALRTAMAN